MNTEQCQGCRFWRNAYNGGTKKHPPMKCCHYMLDTDQRRQRDGDKCLSRKPRRRAK